jgi:DNA-binding IclR family transcriptional regulator
LTGAAGREGWVASVEEREAGVASVSAPVTTGERAIVAAVSVSGPIDRMTRQPGKRFGRQVVEAAADVARSMG